MEHMKFETPDMVEENIEKIKALFPSVMTEGTDENGKIKEVINFEALKQLLSKDVVDGDECYEFTWVGKKAAMAEAAKPTTKTLRPVKEDSKNWDTTENLYIEGDNLEVLKILQESYLGKVKMIYIDPPYNTGHDFVYPDSFVMDNEEYSAGTGYFDEDGNVNYDRENTANAGKYHSDWCSMMYSRLMLARNLLTENGVLFISIDEHEAHNLYNLCTEIFGESNFVANIAVVNNLKGRSDDKFIATAHEQLLIFQKGDFQSYGVKIPQEYISDYKNEDSMGRYRLQGLRKRGSGAKREDRPNMFYPFYYNPQTHILSLSQAENTIEILPKLSDGTDGRWRWGKDTALSRINELTVEIVSGVKYDVFQKDYLFDDKRVKPKSVWIGSEFSAEAGTLQTKSLLGKGIFETVKSVNLIQYCLEQSTAEGDIVLDFFSGSATTAHAVMQQNLEDGGHRKFILVQLPEPCDEKSEAKKAGYSNICEIGKERIRRAGNKIKDENPLGTKDLDIGFRVFRVDDSNMKDVYYHPEEVDQLSIMDAVSNIKEDRTDMDLLYSCLLDWGVEINLPHITTEIDGCTIHNVDNGALMACFNEKVPASVIQYMAKQQPLRAVFRDSGFSADADKINVEETFKNFSPDTSVRVL